MSSTAIILFDGVCNLCHSSVQFIIAHDKAAHFKFASLQSAYGQALLKDHDLPTHDFDSFVLVEKEQVFTESTAALKVARRLDGFWSLLSIFLILPSFIRNPFYRFIARNRYRWFGKKDSCLMPTPELQKRMLDNRTA